MSTYKLLLALNNGTFWPKKQTNIITPTVQMCTFNLIQQ